MTITESICSAPGTDRLVDRDGGRLRILGGEDVVRRAAADDLHQRPGARDQHAIGLLDLVEGEDLAGADGGQLLGARGARPEERSEEHTSELQSRFDLVCRLLLEKKK